MIVEIPITQEGAHFEFFTELDGGASYRLTFRWNARVGAWFMDLADGDGSLIVAGVRVVLNIPLLGKVADSRRPPGELFAIDTSGDELEADFEGLGRRVALYYASFSDLR